MSVTLVIPILGRPLFTLRTLWYLNHIRFPGPIIVADGAENQQLRALIEQGDSFPALNLTYFPRKDANVREFYKKCLAAVRMATTPYVLIHDNDDFITLDALGRLVQFLDDNPGHAAVSGVVASFHMPRAAPGDPLALVQGDPAKWAVIYDPKYLDQPTALERISSHLSRYFPTYYSVHRKAALEDAFRFLVESDISDLPLHELFLSMHSLLPGPITTLPGVIGYIRQANTSEAHATVRSWEHRILQKTWQSEFHRGVGMLSSEIVAAQPDIDRASAEKTVRDGVGWFIATMFDGTAHHGSRPSHIDTMLTELRTLGASAEDCNAFKQSLAPVYECLLGPAFKAFVEAQAAELRVA